MRMFDYYQSAWPGSSVGTFAAESASAECAY